MALEAVDSQLEPHDDGQVVCQPMHVDLVLRTIDEIALKVGLVRGRGENAKTVCRLIGPPSEKSQVGPEWFAEYMRESSVQCNDNDLDGHVLGINFDDRDSTTKQFQEASMKAHASWSCTQID